MEGSLGDVIRRARTGAKLSLRDLSKLVAVTASYLSDIENERRIPSEEVLVTIGKVLDLKFDDMMALAGRFGDQADRYFRRHPKAGALIRRVAELNLGDDDLDILVQQALELKQGKKKR